MPLRWGPGPVFVHESIAAARRWQLYAMRSFYVFTLLSALVLVCLVAYVQDGGMLSSISIKQLAEVGEYFFYAISTTQLMMVLLVAPAATAGAICIDRARGNLTHVLVTELADTEIVLGKLAARLSPVVALVGATIPVLALAGLLGGVIFAAIVSLTLITVALAVFGCSLALALSVRATKTHEVLMAVYGIEFLWILGPVVWALLSSTRVVGGVPHWFTAINPFVLAWAPYAWPNFVSMEWIAGFLGGLMAMSAGLISYAVLRLRAESRRGNAASGSRWASWLGSVHDRLLWWRPGPSLDKDPVLWRECRRVRPSRLGKIVWGLYIALSVTGTAGGILTIVDDYQSGSQFLMFVNAFQATFGLLLVSLFAPTVLAEERVRGGLDALMTTPLSTDRIVLAKWWGAYRAVPALAFLPAIGCLIIAAGAADYSPPGRANQPAPAPLGAIDYIAYVCIPTAILLAQGAVVTSVGLVLATWIHRVGRAVAASVTCYAIFAFGWIILIEFSLELLAGPGLSFVDNLGTMQYFGEVLATACPAGGQMCTFTTTEWPLAQSRSAFYICQIIVLLVTIGFALVMLALALAAFNRCMGRVSERPRRAPRPPRPAAGPATPRMRSG